VYSTGPHQARQSDSSWDSRNIDQNPNDREILVKAITPYRDGDRPTMRASTIRRPMALQSPPICNRTSNRRPTRTTTA